MNIHEKAHLLIIPPSNNMQSPLPWMKMHPLPMMLTMMSRSSWPWLFFRITLYTPDFSRRGFITDRSMLPPLKSINQSIHHAWSTGGLIDYPLHPSTRSQVASLWSMADTRKKRPILQLHYKRNYIKNWKTTRCLHKFLPVTAFLIWLSTFVFIPYFSNKDKDLLDIDVDILAYFQLLSVLHDDHLHFGLDVTSDLRT